jgi:hypothetical protein
MTTRLEAMERDLKALEEAAEFAQQVGVQYGLDCRIYDLESVRAELTRQVAIGREYLTPMEMQHLTQEQKFGKQYDKNMRGPGHDQDAT